MFPKKSMFSNLKFVWGYPTEFAGSTQNPKKNIETSNQPMRTKTFPKKLYLVPLSLTQNPKNNIGTSNQPIKT
jgi:hypothetical protein